MRRMRLKMRFLRLPVYVLAALVAVASVAFGEVTRVDVTSRKPVGTSGYEKIIGVAHFAVNPKDPHNRVIADIDKAPVNANGLVEFSGDVVILRQLDASKSNGVALVDVVNRGRKTIMTTFDRGATADPASDADRGDGFLTRQGYTLVFVGWEFDINRQATANNMRIDVPAAQGATGLVHGDFTPNDASPEQTVTDLGGYSPAQPDATDTTLTVRDGPFGRPEIINRSRFTVKGNAVTLTGGFTPGRTYQLSYRPEKFPVSGLGMAAFRDVATWVKRSPDALARAPKSIAFGSSQSGRFLRTFVYYGFNSDEKGQQVFDGVMAHIAGGARLSLNLRGAEPTALSMYEIATFPFTPTAQRDPISGVSEGLLENERAKGTQPRIFFSNTSVEYWGGGRLRVDSHPARRKSMRCLTTSCVFFLTGAQHGPARFPTKVNQGQQPDNPLEYAYTLRALLVAMTKWVKDDVAPPASRIPRIADGTLVPVTQVNFPEIGGVQTPKIIPAAKQAGKSLPLLVPQVGEDGNELAGVRTAESVVAMATYTGWNFRNASIGGVNNLVNLLGSAIPLPRTKGEREAAHDPRKSVEERYPSRDAYWRRASGRRGSGEGWALLATTAAVMKRIEEQWTVASTKQTQ
jgi:hypothetical protein